MAAPDLYDLKTVARKCCGVQVRTVQRWVRMGWLPAAKQPGKNKYCVSDVDLTKFILNHYYKRSHSRSHSMLDK